MAKDIPLEQKMQYLADYENPAWVFDLDYYRILWANQNGLKFWKADSFEELASRDLSPRAEVGLENIKRYKRDLTIGSSITEVWTFYPDNKPVHYNAVITGVATDDARLAIACTIDEQANQNKDILHCTQAIINTSVMISLYNINGELLYANPAAVRVFDASTNKLQSKFNNPEIAQRIIEQAEKKSKFRISEQVLTNSGLQWHDIEVSFSLNSETRCTDILLSETNASELHDFKKAEQLADKIFKSMVETSPNAILVCDNRTIILANHEASKLLGTEDPAHLKGMILSSLINEGDRALFEDYIRLDGKDTNASIELKMERLQDETFRACMIAVKANYMGRAVLHILFQDMEESLRAAEEMKRKDKHLSMLQNIIDKSSDGALILEKSGKIFYANETLCNRLGYSTEEILTKTVSDLAPHFSENGWKNHWKRVKEYGSVSLESLQLTKAGKTIDIELTVKYFSMEGREYHLSFSRVIGASLYEDEQSQMRAQLDELTQTANRSLFLQHCSQAIESSESDNYRFAILFLDLDNFKQVNDAMGHSIGDQLLVAVAKRLDNALGDNDILARLSGDEFAILVKKINNDVDIELYAQRIQAKFSRPFTLEDNILHITSSIGIAVYPQDGKESLELLRRADMAMYQAKIKGPNQYKRYSSSMHQLARLRLDREEKLRSALKNNELEVYYQPFVAVNGIAITGAESLLRWKNPDLGFVSPPDFIPIAEQTGLIIPIGYFVIESAVKQLTLWQKIAADKCNGNTNIDDMVVSINVSVLQLTDPDFFETVSSIIEKYAIKPKQLIIEITESVLLESDGLVKDNLDKIAKTDIQLALDDFGTGYSSLTYLRRFPFNILKIDKEFVDNCIESPSDNEIVRASIAMAHSMDMTVIAEGVEYREQSEHLGKLNSDWLQGYYYSRPISGSAMIDLMQTLSTDFCIDPERTTPA